MTDHVASDGPVVRDGPDATAVEFLDGVDDRPPDRPGRPNWQRACAMGVAVLITILLAAASLSNQRDPEIAELHRLDVYYGDPFDVEWINLVSEDRSATASDQPGPMASVEPACIGFARPDWPVERRHPSVAHCISGESLAQLGADESFGSWQIVAGTKTWVLLYFPDPIEDFQANVDDGTPVAIDQIHSGGPFVATAIPTNSAQVTLSWRTQNGLAYRCDIDRRSTDRPMCT